MSECPLYRQRRTLRRAQGRAVDAIRTTVEGKGDVAAPASPPCAVDCGGPRDDASVTPRDDVTVTPGVATRITIGDGHGPLEDVARATPGNADTPTQVLTSADGATVAAE
jgi:hypothetical protein